ncbi:MAG: dienelactone hydrolase family protein [Caulobacterales bacterium]
MSERIHALEPHFALAKPEGASRTLKAVILLHGCGGRKPIMDNYAKAVTDAGAAALIVDSYAHRGIGRHVAYATVCTGARLQGRERAGDLYAAFAWLRAQPWCGPVIAAGWSHGSWTIMDALTMESRREGERATGIHDLPDEPLKDLAGAFLVYPYVGPGSLARRKRWRLTPETIAIVGGRDLIVGAKAPMQTLNDLRASGAPIETHLFETATHAFDEGDAKDLRVRYDPALTARAEHLLTQLIERV